MTGKPGGDARAGITVVQVNTLDSRGGAAGVARGLHEDLLARGLRSRMIVGRKSTGDLDVLELPNERARPWRERALTAAANAIAGDSRVRRRLSRWTRSLANPARARAMKAGREDFDFPATWDLPRLAGGPIDVLHLHNLHGRYFDLTALPWLSHSIPTVLTLHDAWLMSGHCAHSLDCERWLTGCGLCPDLSLPPSIAADGTAENWTRKQDIYSRSRLHVTAPCEWLMDRARRSILAPAMVEERVIPLGVDLSVFHPGDRLTVRGSLGIPEKVRMVLVTADRGRRNPWKDFETARGAMQRAGDLLPDTELLFVALGNEGGEEGIGRSVLRGVPHEDDPARVADWYRAADAYLHPSRADTFPLAVLEAMACGLPVIASDVGGISEQVVPLRGESSSAAEGQAGPTGELVPAGKDEPMAAALCRLFTQPELHRTLSRNGLERARARFDGRRYAETMIDWYSQLARLRGDAAR